VGGGGGGAALQRSSTAASSAVAAALATDTLPSAWESEWGEGSAEGGAVAWVRGVVSRLTAQAQAAAAAAATPATPPSGSGGNGGGGGGGGGCVGGDNHADNVGGSSPALRALLARPLSLGAYFHPLAVLTALRQASARQYVRAGIAEGGLASLRLVGVFSAARVPELERECGAGALLVVTLRGVQLQGALWNEERGVIQAPSAGSSDLCPLPSVQLVWLPPRVQDPYPPANCTPLPLYTSSARGAVLAQIFMPFSPSADPAKERAQWALAGAALFVQE
jgi:hypothetical protein